VAALNGVPGARTGVLPADTAGAAARTISPYINNAEIRDKVLERAKSKTKIFNLNLMKFPSFPRQSVDKFTNHKQCKNSCNTEDNIFV
jgi:hypothetical protein